jgi:hypothetical protein
MAPRCVVRKVSALWQSLLKMLDTRPNLLYKGHSFINAYGA